MGDGEVQVLAHAVVPVVLMAARSADNDSSSSTWGALKDIGSGAAWNAAQEHRDEVLSEYTGDDVSKEDYQQELETTANEATKHDYAFIPEGEYGDKIASYLQDNAPDVEIERYSVPGDEADDSGLKGTSNDLSYRQKKEMFPNYRHPSSVVRKQKRQAKEEYENAGVLGKAGRIFARMGETEESFAEAPDYRSWKSEDPPYADMDFVSVEGGPDEGGGGDDSGSGFGGSGLGSSHTDEAYGGKVVDEFMSTGFNEYAKVETEDGDIKYLKNGEETSQQSYAAAVQHEAPDKEPPSADAGSPADDFGDEEETVYTAAGKEWQKTTETIEDMDTGEEREVVQVYENGQPRIDYGEDEDIVEEQKKRALNAFSTAKSQHAMPVYTESDEQSQDTEQGSDEEYEGGVLDAVKAAVGGTVEKGKTYVEKQQEKRAVRKEYAESGGGARLRELQRKDSLTEEEQREKERLHQQRFELTDRLEEIDENYETEDTDYLGRIKEGLKNSYEAAASTLSGDESGSESPQGAGGDHAYDTLLDQLQDVHRDDGSALVITDKTYQDDVENALDDGGFDYTAKDAL